MSEEVKDYIGTIVTATCESVDEKRIMLTFADQERAFLTRNELPEIKVGESVEIYIDGMTKAGLWAASTEMVSAQRLFKKISDAKKDQTDLDVTVVASEDNGLVCDVCSMYGFMPRREIEEAPLADLDGYLGQSFKARVIKFSMSDGKLIISHKAAVAQQLREAREILLAQLKPEQVYDGIVKQIVDFGVFVDIGSGVEGLVHRSNFSWDNEDPAAVVSIGDKIQVKVLAVEQGRISLGRKQLLPDTWAESIQSLHVGDVVEGKVTTFANFGAFVRIQNKIEGLVHLSELSWDTNVRHPQQVLELNDVIQVKIIGIDEERRRLKLSIRQLTENPWKTAADSFPVGSVQKFIVSGIAEFGVFVEIGFGLRGLIHKNDIQWSGNVPDLNKLFKLGDPVECKVLNIDVEKERASLGIKQLTRDPFDEFLDEKPLGHQFEVTVQRIARFGAFASINKTSGLVEGLIHISELSEGRVEHVESVLKTNQVVTVTVISIDKERRRIGLSLIAEPFEPKDEENGEQEKSEETTPSEEETESSKPTMADIFPEELVKH